MRKIMKLSTSLMRLSPKQSSGKLLTDGYIEKLVYLQGTLKLHLLFYNRILRLQTSRNEKNWHANYSLRAHSMATNESISQG